MLPGHRLMEESKKLLKIGIHFAKSWLPYWGSNESYIYLRRTHGANDDMVNDHEEALVGRSIPPIFLARRLPGDFSVVDETYDTSLGIDAGTWALLQSKHQEHQNGVRVRDRVSFRIVTIVHRLFMAFLLAFFLIWAWNDRGGILLGLVLACILCYLCLCCFFARTMWKAEQLVAVERVKVVERVNEALPEDGHLALELHTSAFPGRGDNSYLRYQFVYKMPSSQQEVV